MATRVFRGDQPALAEVKTIAVTGTWAAGDTATLTINDKSVTITIGTAATIPDVVAAIVAGWNGTTMPSTSSVDNAGPNVPEFNEITASGSDTPITLTHGTKGVPFTVTASEVTAGTGALGAPTQTVAPDGPNELSADNVTGGSLTPTGNELVFENGTVAVKYGLDQSAAGTWDLVHIKASHEAAIGLPRGNGAGTNFYSEYRDRELQINATGICVGAGDTGDGSGRLLLNMGSVQSSIRVFKTATSLDDDFYACRIRGTHASNTMEVSGGSVDVAPEGGQTATLATLTVSGSGVVRTSPGTTLTTVNVLGNGQLIIDQPNALSDITTINIFDQGSVIIMGDNAATTINLFGGTLDYRSSGTITNLNMSDGARITTENATIGFTVTNSTLYGGTISDRNKWVTWTNPSSVPNGLAGLNLDVGRNINVRIS